MYIVRDKLAITTAITMTLIMSFSGLKDCYAQSPFTDDNIFYIASNGERESLTYSILYLAILFKVSPGKGIIKSSFV